VLNRARYMIPGMPRQLLPGNPLPNGYFGANSKRVSKDMIRLMRKLDPYMLYSGGRDSLVALHITTKLANTLHKQVHALHVDTTAATPGNREYVERSCKELGVDLIVLKPKVDYFTLVEKWGFPVMTRRWCKRYLKVFPVRDFLRDKDREKLILVDGVRAQESWMKRSIRNQTVEKPWRTYHDVLKCQVIHPVYDWSLDLVIAYVQRNQLQENPLYEVYGKAFDCWCTVFKSPADLATLAVKNPQYFHRLVDLEATQRNGGSALFDRAHSRRVYLRDIEAHPEDYLNEGCSKTCACMTL
jgi:3'-phosphoadenosine 5'-phosphosulfate sulfotransferase (PAPS reductase)/FAD synthetase